MFKVLGKIDESVDLKAEDEKVMELSKKYRDEVEKSLDWLGNRELSDDEFDEMYDWIADNAKDGDVDVQELKRHMQNYVLQHDGDDENDDFENRNEAVHEGVADEADVGEDDEEECGGEGHSLENVLKAVHRALRDALKAVNQALDKSVVKPKNAGDRGEDGEMGGKDGDDTDADKKDVDGAAKKKVVKAKKDEKDDKGAVDFDKIVGKAYVTKDSGSKTFKKTDGMTLDEAIRHASEVARKADCAAEHKQLAEWLKELKKLRSIRDDFTSMHGDGE